MRTGLNTNNRLAFNPYREKLMNLLLLVINFGYFLIAAICDAKHVFASQWFVNFTSSTWSLFFWEAERAPYSLLRCKVFAFQNISYFLVFHFVIGIEIVCMMHFYTPCWDASKNYLFKSWFGPGVDTGNIALPQVSQIFFILTFFLVPFKNSAES